MPARWISSCRKQHLIYAAQHQLLRQATLPPRRFDLAAIDGEQLTWLQAAFDAG